MIQQSHSWTYIQRNPYWKMYKHPDTHCSTIYKSQDMEEACLSNDREMDKDGVHICNRILLSHEEERKNAICSNMDSPRDYRTK